jgi:hypothetical protein
LFNLTTWHAYAKLRLHTDTTLNEFRTITSTLETAVRTFIKEVTVKSKVHEFHTFRLLNDLISHISYMKYFSIFFSMKIY